MENLKQFNNSTSWREDNIKIQPKECFTLTFLGTNPNMFYLQNPNNTRLHIGISKTPTANNYEFVVGANSSKAFGKPTGTRYVYIYNDGEMVADVKIFSLQDIFDLSILNDISLNMDNVNIELGTELKTEITGFSEGVSLPSGNNNIGNVGLSASSRELLQSIIDNTRNGNSLLGDIKTKNGNILDLITAGTMGNILEEILKGIKATELSIGNLEMGDVNVDPEPIVNGIVDGMYKKESQSIVTDEYYRINTTLPITTDYENTEYINGYSTYYIDEGEYILNIGISGGSIAVSDTNVVVTSGSITFPNIHVQGSTATLVAGKRYEVSSTQVRTSTGTKYVVKYADFINAFLSQFGTMYVHTIEKLSNVEEGTDTGELRLQTIELKEVSETIYNYSGVLSSFPKAIKKPSLSFSEKMGVNQSRKKIVAFENSTPENPIKIADKIEYIKNVGDAEIIAKIYYTWADCIDYIIPPNSEIGGFEFPIYALSLSIQNGTGTNESIVNVHGGYYDI